MAAFFRFVRALPKPTFQIASVTCFGKPRYAASGPLGLTGEVMATLAHAQATGDVVLIHGRSGAGKSRALRRYADTRSGVHLLTVTSGITSLGIAC